MVKEKLDAALKIGRPERGEQRRGYWTGLTLLYGLFSGGLIHLRTITRWGELPATVQYLRCKHGLLTTLDNAV